MLRVEWTKDGKKMKLPPFVKVVREVTEDIAYEAWRMATNNYKMPEADVIAIQDCLLNEKANDPAQPQILERIHQTNLMKE